MSNAKISKFDAARRQLETAIRIYFSHGDPVAIHTLAAAAYELLDDLLSKFGGPQGFKDTFLSMLTPEGVELVRQKLNAAQNFFKHADRDHDQVLDFYPEATELFLLDGCERYFALTKERVPLFDVFRAWFTIGGFGRNLTLPAEHERVKRLVKTVMPNPTRQAFLAEALPAAALLAGGGRNAGS